MSANGSTVHWVEERSRYELSVDGTVVGLAEVEVVGALRVFPHTVVDPAHRGKGYAALLVEGALAHVAAQGATVRPDCWYVAQYLEDHPEWGHLRAGH